LDKAGSGCLGRGSDAFIARKSKPSGRAIGSHQEKHPSLKLLLIEIEVLGRRVPNKGVGAKSGGRPKFSSLQRHMLAL